MDSETINNSLKNNLSNYGFEVYPFLVSWYNAVVDSSFHLTTYDENTVAFLIVSTPSMFEKSFLPYILDHNQDLGRDPIDCCVKEKVQDAAKCIKDHEFDIIYDYDLWPSRRPKIVMQSVGHVAGASFFYSREHLRDDPFPKERKLMGLCLHPKYGGWFALRAVIIVKTLQTPSLPRSHPIDVLSGNDSLIIDALTRFNDSWQDNSYRSVIPVEETYSELQRSYFHTMPKDRFTWLEKFRQSHSS